MKISQESGVVIDDELRKIIQKALEKAGGKVNRLAKMSGCKQPSVDRWVGKNQDKTDIISWDAWLTFRQFLGSIGLLDVNDPKWMIPSELLKSVRMNCASDEREVRLLSLFRKLDDDQKGLIIENLEAMTSNRI